MLQVGFGEHHRHAFALEAGHDFGKALRQRGRDALERLIPGGATTPRGNQGVADKQALLLGFVKLAGLLSKFV